MPVNARSLVKPTFFHTGICPHRYYILSPKIQVFGHIKRKTGITTGLVSTIKTVDPDTGVPVNTVKFQKNTLALIFYRQGKAFPVPAHAGLRKSRSHCFISMRVTGMGCKALFGGPIMRQVKRPPTPVVKLRSSRPIGITCLGQIGEITGTHIKIPGNICSVPVSKFPIEIHQKALTYLSMQTAAAHAQQ